MNVYVLADMLLKHALERVKDIKKHNGDEYGLLKSAMQHISEARFDLEADTK